MISHWIKEIKSQCSADLLGMILVHNGIVRATAKNGKPVEAMRLSHNRARLEAVVKEFGMRDGIVDIRVWINEGVLKTGDDIMNLCIAGRFRTDVLPVFEELLTIIKKEIVIEEEIHSP
jgi:molybdopterin synthase catalytic subunit